MQKGVSCPDYTAVMVSPLLAAPLQILSFKCGLYVPENVQLGTRFVRIFLLGSWSPCGRCFPALVHTLLAESARCYRATAEHLWSRVTREKAVEGMALKFTWNLHLVILSRHNCSFFFKCVNNDFSAYLNFWYLEGGCHLKNVMVCNLYSLIFFLS